MKNPEIFPGSNILVKGKIPPSSLLLIGPTGVGKTIFCKHFLYNGLLAGEPCIYVTTSETPEEIEVSMKSFGLDIEPYKETEMVRIIDACSWKLGRGSASEYAVDGQQNYLTSLSIIIKKARSNLRNVRLIFDSVSELTAIANKDAVLKFLQI